MSLISFSTSPLPPPTRRLLIVSFPFCLRRPSFPLFSSSSASVDASATSSRASHRKLNSCRLEDATEMLTAPTCLLKKFGVTSLRIIAACIATVLVTAAPLVVHSFCLASSILFAAAARPVAIGCTVPPPAAFPIDSEAENLRAQSCQLCPSTTLVSPLICSMSCRISAD